MIIFGVGADILAFIFTNEPIYALIWDIIYGILVIVGFIGYLKNNYVLLQIFSFSFLIDAIIACLVMILLANNDLSFGGFKNETAIITFAFFAVIQTIFFVMLMKIFNTIEKRVKDL